MHRGAQLTSPLTATQARAKELHDIFVAHDADHDGSLSHRR
jgi:hypothetical protein